MSIDINIYYTYDKNDETQAEQFKSCKGLIDKVISSLIEQGRGGDKTEFSNLRDKTKTSNDIHKADFIIGDPSYPKFQLSYTSEAQSILRPIPSVIILPDDTWGDDVNSILKNPLYDIRGIFRASKLYPESGDADELGRFLGSYKDSCSSDTAQKTASARRIFQSQWNGK